MNISESQTRLDLIDIQLAKAGWNVNDPSKVAKEYYIRLRHNNSVADAAEKYAGYEKSDYVLIGRDGSPMAVVEAKKTTLDPDLGKEQAKQYCYNIQHQLGCELPFCFYTNGLEIYFWDLENAPPRKVVGFPTLDDLERFAYIRRNRKPLTEELINTKIVDRAYQIRAIRAVLEGIEKKHRDFLLVMATGTGKTRTCIALADALMRAGHAEKVLFLVDRISLRSQALDAFREFLPNEPRWPESKETELALDRRIYISTLQTMINIVHSDNQKLSPHFFDLIIIDESHRSIYNSYLEIIDYFKAINVGLTATPTDVVDHNTFELFKCQDGIPTFAYTYEEALNNLPPYLCNFQVMKIQTGFQLEGISKRTISLEDQKKLILEGKDIEEINFEGSDIEKKVINDPTNVLIVREFMEESIKDSSGVLPGKTIFFCTSIKHARRIEKIFNSLYPEYNGEIARVIVSNYSRVHGDDGLLDQFKSNDMPRIAISVDMLDTGIDVREIVNLVFVKPVYSYTKFWQMIGRGTRLLESDKIKPWCTEKDIFLILDCWDNFEYFKLNPAGKELKPQIPLPVKVVSTRIDKIEKAYEKGQQQIQNKEITTLKAQIAQLPQASVTIKEAMPDLNKVSDDSFWNSIDHEKLDFLREKIRPLFRTYSDADYKALRFERDLLEASLAHLSNDDDKYNTLVSGIISQISKLPMTVQMVKREESLIRKASDQKFWQSVTDGDFDHIATKIAPLMKLCQGGGSDDPIEVSFTDSLAKKDKVEFGPQHQSASVARYREMVEKMILELTESNLVLQKIRDGAEPDAEEIQELADLLHAEHPHITQDLLRTVYKNRNARFVQFIRHILGVEKLLSFPDAVTEAFDQFVSQHSGLNGRQLDFLNLLKDFIIEREKITRPDLIRSPFTVIHPQGIRGVFQPNEIEEILQLTQKLVA